MSTSAPRSSFGSPAGSGTATGTSRAQAAPDASGSTLSLTSPAQPHEGDTLAFHYSTDAPDPKNWIGIYGRTQTPGDVASLVWDYVTATSGDLALSGAGLTAGDYTAYLLAKDAYGVLAQTQFTLVAQPAVVLPHAVADSFTTGARQAREAVSVPLAGLWTRPKGNPAGTPSFRRLEGDSWLSVTKDGTVTGTTPAHPSARPGRIAVAVKDSAGGSDTVTVQVPVRQAGARPLLTVASLNLWDAGAHVDGAAEKHLRFVLGLGTGLDVLGVQESGGTAATALAKALGWHAYESAAGVGLVSRFPLTGTATPGAGLPAVAATVQVPGGPAVRLWAAQLDEAAYGPYAVRDGQGRAQVEAAERKTVRYTQVTALLAAMKHDIAGSDGMPVVLAAGLASPSHLDGTGKVSVDWPVTEALAHAGLTDAYREANPRATKDPGTTWSPVRPDEPQDRVDQVQFAGAARVESAYTVCTGWPAAAPGTASNGWPSDHAAPVVTLSLPARRS